MGAAATAAERPKLHRHIWLVADDYGISHSVNAAIRDLMAHGRINATSVMVVAPGFDRKEADLLSAIGRGSRPGAIGLHLTLTAPFRPRSRGYAPIRGGAFLPLGRTAIAAFLGRLDRRALADEMKMQIAAFVAAFERPPDFIDGHQHVHLFPQISDCLLATMKEAAPGAWVRQCGRPAMRRSLADRKALLLDLLSRRLRQRAAAAGVRTNPAFAGTYDFRPDANFADLFPTFLADLPDGGVVMCHPGGVDAELVRLDPLTTLREREYEFFKGEAYKAIMTARGVELV